MRAEGLAHWAPHCPAAGWTASRGGSRPSALGRADPTQLLPDGCGTGRRGRLRGPETSRPLLQRHPHTPRRPLLVPARPCPPRAPPGLPEVRGTDLGMAAQPLWVSVPRGWSCPSPWPRRSCGGAGPQQRPWTVASGGFCPEDPGAPPLTVAHVIRGVSRSPGVAQLPRGPLGCPPVRWLPPVTVPVAGWEADARRGASQHALGSADRPAGQPCLRGTRQEA